jgi:ribonuclease HII
VSATLPAAPPRMPAVPPVPPAPPAVPPAPPARTAVRRPTLEVERRLWRDGHRWVAGIDEVGRGAWAGPLSVGVAVLHANLRTRSLPRWLRDSKMLPEERRELVFDDVARWCADAAVGHATADECDRFGMTKAWRLAAHRALADLEIVPDALVIDGPYDFLKERLSRSDEMAADEAEAVQGQLDLAFEIEAGIDAAIDVDILSSGCAPCAPATPPPNGCTGVVPSADGISLGRVEEVFELPAVRLPSTVLTMVGADARCAAVSAASVLAKVVRDRMMREEAVHFPPYGFDRNKGYPSPHHQIALRGYGLSAIHRRSWAFVADLPWR